METSQIDGNRSAEPRSGRSTFADLLFAHAPVEDLARYRPETIEEAARLAHAALENHKRGESLVSVEADPGISVDGRPVTAITVINDNMPFLFDSLLGEITEVAGEPHLVVHPVILVRHEANGAFAGIDALSEAGGDVTPDKVSIIHVHTSRLPEQQAEALKARLGEILAQVRIAVSHWRPMLDRLQEAIDRLRAAPPGLDQSALDEAVAFLEWLRDDNFTFLGMRDFLYSGDAEEGTLDRADVPGLGILSDPDVRVLRRGTEPAVTTPEIRAFLHGPEPLLVTKANAKALVHRRVYLDYIGVKTFHADGSLQGELRIVGLFTSTAYTRSVLKIPYLRSKAQAVIAGSGFDPKDHSGKALINVLEAYPRDELFQIDLPTLHRNAEAILALGERPRVRVLTRFDQFDRFVSVLVFVPRDRYDSTVRERIGSYLREVFDGRVSAFYPAFPEGGLARIHFIIGRSDGETPKPAQAELEKQIRAIVRTWEDGLREAGVDTGADLATMALAAHFPESYRDSFTPVEALADAGRVASLGTAFPIAIDYYRRPDHSQRQLALKIYHHGAPLPLSRRVPLLENMGFRVISERTFEIEGVEGPKGSEALPSPVFIHDMELETGSDQDIDIADEGELFEAVFLSVAIGHLDDDGYNALALTAGLTPSEILVMRAYGRYLQQAGIPQSQDVVAAVLNRYAAIASALYRLFAARLRDGDGEAQAALEKEILAALDRVPSLEDDTILRRILNLIQSTLRTNHFARSAAAGAQTLALKLDSRAVTGLPEPRPWREIFVYGTEVEGVHLRFGPVARGGLRWSDRAQDYRTEVLGLVKAQQVKNAVIVPVGAKGGFFPKALPQGGSREAVFEAGRNAYITFISTLLSITDDIEGDHVVPPEGLVRLDGDDPYFVVAADKGTATFSDTANAISQEHGFWLDDAFASGGSAGYDHKKMGITARGAWEAVKRHFREMNRDIQTTPFTTVGVGDMSGDVFGNGMLLSEQNRLIAAFDHRDIFIDPAPDAATSFAERKRLFDLPRSSWQDYDKEKLSPGGMVVPRSQKSITLSAEAAAAIGLEKTVASPVEIMSAILKTPVDLLWFGGIGTYVRGSSESNAEVGDRTNDAIRVTASEIGAKVIGEGANLGVTQRARIEYGLAGGRCNSDAIDNSAGVNSSDIEVNIKIALAPAMRAGRLPREDRNRLLAAMTDEVAALVLDNNYRQTLALSLARHRGLADLPHQRRFITGLEERGLLDRSVEFLPADAALVDREKRGVPLTRAEIGILLAYAKLTLFPDLVASDLLDDPLFDRDLLGYFPQKMAVDYRDEILSHRLRREIIATELANDVVDRGGPAFVARMSEMTGASAAEVVDAYVLVRDGFDLPALYKQIDALDNIVDGTAQLDFYAVLARLTHGAVASALKHGGQDRPLGERVGALKTARAALEDRFAELMPDFMREGLKERAHGYFKAGAPEPVAGQLALIEVLAVLPEIMRIAQSADSALDAAARAFFDVTALFRIGRIVESARMLSPTDYYDGLALTRALETMSDARDAIASEALRLDASGRQAAERWAEAGGAHVGQVRERLQALTESGDLSVSRLTVAAGLLADLVGSAS